MSNLPDALLSAVVAATPEIAAFVQPDGDIGWVNPAFVARWRCAQTATVSGLLDVVHPDDRASVEDALALVRADGTHTVVRRARLGCDHTYWQGQVRLSRLPNGETAGGIVIHAQLIDSGVAVSIGVDPLTGLCDRAGLLGELDAALAAGGNADLLLFDLDNFRLVNESLGHATGDDVLSTIAQRLRRSAHADDVVARLSADEFAIVCPHVSLATEELVATLREQISRPVALGGSEHVVDSSVGVVSLTTMSGTVEALAAADCAVFLAKCRGRGRVEVFDSGLRDTAIKTLRRTSELRHAAAKDELTLYYQPIIDLSTGATIGCEALLRWIHPTEGQLTAGEFIEIAEASGLINELTEKLLTDSCSAARRLAELTPQARTPAYVSVNLSPRQLADPRLLDWVDSTLHASGIKPSQLMVEITETAMMHDVPSTVATLTALRQRGLRVALDDFGTGFSSLLRLRELPVDCLKIDRAFVAGMERASDDLAIVASVVNMACTLGLHCVAEGVETPTQVEQLRQLGCTSGQGFLWSPGVPLADVLLQPRIRTAQPDARTRPATLTNTAREAWIMRLHHSGESLQSIADLLNQSGARTERGRRWYPRTVARVVSNNAYPHLGTG